MSQNCQFLFPRASTGAQNTKEDSWKKDKDKFFDALLTQEYNVEDDELQNLPDSNTVDAVVQGFLSGEKKAETSFTLETNSEPLLMMTILLPQTRIFFSIHFTMSIHLETGEDTSPTRCKKKPGPFQDHPNPVLFRTTQILQKGILEKLSFFLNIKINFWPIKAAKKGRNCKRAYFLAHKSGYRLFNCMK